MTTTLLTYAQAAALIGPGIGVKFIRARVQSGDLRGTDLGYRTKRIAPLDLQRYLDASKTLERRRKF